MTLQDPRPPGGLAVDSWAALFQEQALLIEAAVDADPSPGAALAAEVPYCAGWAVRDVLAHLGVVHRLVHTWIREGRRPRTLAEPPGGPHAGPRAGLQAGLQVVEFFAVGWRQLHALLLATPPSTPAATWSPWDATVGFWGRRQAHEIAVHAFDVLSALQRDGEWQASISPKFALDGVDEVVRLWLGTRLADQAGGAGDVVRLVSADPVAGERFWTVGLHGSIAEVHDLPTPPDAVVRAEPEVLYRWLWGRAEDDELSVEGDPDAVAALQAALIRVTQ